MHPASLIAGAAAGSALMFMLDPGSGRRRRALVRDQAVRATRKTREELDATARDLANRTSGLGAAAKQRWSNSSVSDQKLVERVRAKLGHVCSHPRAIEVEAHDGRITLRGPVLSSEATGVLSTAGAVPGVTSVHSELDVHDSPDGISALQGDGRVGRSARDLFGTGRARATRLAVSGLVATGLWMVVAARRGSQDPEERHASL